jgi:transaldolase
LAASKKPEYAQLMDVAIEYGKDHGNTLNEKVDAALDRLLVEFGKEILKIVPGRVSTEVDARFSFDMQGSINKALHIIDVRHSMEEPTTDVNCFSCTNLSAFQVIVS